AVNRLLDRLDAFGIADTDITASGLDASEDVDYGDNGKRVSNGFLASRSVTVLLRDIDRLNDFLDSGLAAGATGIGSVRFESSREDALRAQARQQAVADASTKAAEIAAAFGSRVGPVYSIGSINSHYADGYSATTLDRIQVTGSRMSRGRYVQPEVEYAETVNAVFELLR
ncbi:MAG: SIMPL domain-containing protein, partial [Luteimonas sp.]|nr:SIMPL domain-containing protein [Luteimonas sp.]